MVRMRHWLMKVEVEWKDVCAREARRFWSPGSSRDDEENAAWLVEVMPLWQNWIETVKSLVRRLEKRDKDLGDGEIVVPGWGP